MRYTQTSLENRVRVTRGEVYPCPLPPTPQNPTPVSSTRAVVLRSSSRVPSGELPPVNLPLVVLRPPGASLTGNKVPDKRPVTDVVNDRTRDSVVTHFPCPGTGPLEQSPLFGIFTTHLSTFHDTFGSITSPSRSSTTPSPVRRPKLPHQPQDPDGLVS